MSGRAKSTIIGVTGKGGSGKTAFVSIVVKVLTNKAKILAIDGDAAGGLPYALGMEVGKTIGDIRRAIIDDPKARKEMEDRHIRTVITEALSVGRGFSLLVMGRAEGPGCYCRVNELLRYGIDSLSKDFDLVVIDCEAGPEQVSRRVIEKADLLVIMVDNSIRCIQVASVISKLAQDVKYREFDRMGLVLNRYNQGSERVREATKQLGLQIFGYIPEDQNIVEYDLQGRPLIELPDTSPSVIAVQDILRNMNL
jgi:CO dehydrogenase maturation factor